MEWNFGLSKAAAVIFMFCWRYFEGRDKNNDTRGRQDDQDNQLLKMHLEEVQSHCDILRQRGVEKIDRACNKWFAENFRLRRKLSS